MTIPDFTPTSTNGHNRPAVTVAERHGYGAGQGAAGAASAATMPTPGRAVRPSLAAKLRPWLIGAVLGLLVGLAAALTLAYQVMPVQATEVQRVFADVNGDGAADLIVSGWVIYAPKAGGQ